MSKQPRPHLPTPSQTFNHRKFKILSALAVPDEEYTDLSPKGSVDVGIRDLIDELNTREGLVTTSSCAGRVSVYLEGPSKTATITTSEEDERNNVRSSAAGGKGGGEWLFVSHDPISTLPFQGSLEELFGLRQWEDGKGEDGEEGRMVHFKFEPMILHILTASHGHAQRVIQAGMEAGFREAGAVSLLSRQDDDHHPIVAIRSMGLSFESLIGVEGSDGVRRAVVSSGYLKRVVANSEKLFKENEKRIARFKEALKSAFEEKPKAKEGWEDAEARRERKRLEGLKRKEEMQRQKEAEAAGIADTEPSTAQVILEPPEVL
ncbi:methyltransferase TYW3-domain-containing protein [Triangularia verruculosa]|uniref:tRNA(Phe) 7-[(3-amino-3-carboxypropyl)-4-demethylwyosine(37)-N(4)]-methyltransferase n=1 Tax=Triangularia verruculosa TaxID=2587418 RepID=A0AAN6X561_9PEZI|nr:methyltransferase TYW3-domain-containing protein [Triangularia verruculosa]